MSGGIRYRPTPKENKLFGEYFFQNMTYPGLYESVHSHLKKKGMDIIIDDPEFKIKTEDGEDGFHISVTYPLDKDQIIENGRLYLEDQFVLSKQNFLLLQHRRVINPVFNGPDKEFYWGKLQAELSSLPSFPTNSPFLWEINEDILIHLHRPFPENLEQVGKEIEAVLGDISGEIKILSEEEKKHGEKLSPIKINFTDSQSGISVYQRDHKIFMTLTLVIDDDKIMGWNAEKNGRIYLRDTYIIDPQTHQVLDKQTERQFEKNPRTGKRLDKLFDRLKKTSKPSSDLPQLNAFVQWLLDKLGVEREGKPATRGVPQDTRTQKLPGNFQSLQVLGVLAQELNAQISIEEKSWIKQGWRALRGKTTIDPQLRQFAVGNFLNRVKTFQTEKNVPLREAVQQTQSQVPLEEEIKNQLLQDPIVGELLSIFDNPNEKIRNENLTLFAQTHLIKTQNLSNTAQAILEITGTSTPRGKELSNWLHGKASFGQKLDRVFQHLVPEGLSPITILSMVFAGGAASAGKLAFFGRFGYETRALQLAAEGTAFAIEAPAFVISDKLMTSAFISTDQQWNHPFGDLFSAYLSFGALRSVGFGTKSLNRYWSDLPALERFSERMTKFKWAENLLSKTQSYVDNAGLLSPAVDKLFEVPNSALRYLAETGVSHRLAIPFLQQMTTHTLTPASLMLANSLSRYLDYRHPSKQGLKADLMDDALMYGNFLLSGKIAHAFAFKGLNARLADIEANRGPPQSLRPAWEEVRRSVVKAWKAGIELPWLRRPLISPAGSSGTPPKTAPYFSSAPPRPEIPAVAFLKLAPIELSGSHKKMEWLIGRETPENIQRGHLLDIPFSSQYPQVAPRHLKIYQTTRLVKPNEGKTKDNVTKYFLSPLDGETYVGDTLVEIPRLLVNGTIITLGKDGPRVKFHQKGVTDFAELAPEPISLPQGQYEWTAGRDHSKAKQNLDICFPASALGISRKHAVIQMDPEKNSFSIFDQGTEGTFVNGEKLYPNEAFPLKEGDILRLGNEGSEFTFTVPKPAPQSPTVLLSSLPKPPSPPLNLPPEQAKVHASFRGMTRLEIAKFMARLNSDPTLNPADGIAAILKFSEGEPVRLLANQTGWILGKNPQGPIHQSPIPLSSDKVSPNHAAIYIDNRGRYILQELASESGLRILPRHYIPPAFVPQTNIVEVEGHWVLSRTPLKKVNGWTLLNYGDRIYFGSTDSAFYLDFWPRVVPTPQELSIK